MDGSYLINTRKQLKIVAVLDQWAAQFNHTGNGRFVGFWMLIDDRRRGFGNAGF